MMNVAVNEARVNCSNLRCYSTGQSGNRLLFNDIGGIPLKQKIVLIVFVTLQMAVAGILLRSSMIGIVILIAVYAGFIISMLFIVRIFHIPLPCIKT